MGGGPPSEEDIMSMGSVVSAAVWLCLSDVTWKGLSAGSVPKFSVAVVI